MMCGKKCRGIPLLILLIALICDFSFAGRGVLDGVMNNKYLKRRVTIEKKKEMERNLAVRTLAEQKYFIQAAEAFQESYAKQFDEYPVFKRAFTFFAEIGLVMKVLTELSYVPLACYWTWKLWVVLFESKYEMLEVLCVIPFFTLFFFLQQYITERVPFFLLLKYGPYHEGQDIIQLTAGVYMILMSMTLGYIFWVGYARLHSPLYFDLYYFIKDETKWFFLAGFEITITFLFSQYFILSEFHTWFATIYSHLIWMYMATDTTYLVDSVDRSVTAEEPESMTSKFIYFFSILSLFSQVCYHLDVTRRLIFRTKFIKEYEKKYSFPS